MQLGHSNCHHYNAAQAPVWMRAIWPISEVNIKVLHVTYLYWCLYTKEHKLMFLQLKPASLATLLLTENVYNSETRLQKSVYKKDWTNTAAVRTYLGSQPASTALHLPVCDHKISHQCLTLISKCIKLHYCMTLLWSGKCISTLYMYYVTE